MTKRADRKEAPDITSYEILIRPDFGEAATMTLAEFLREHASRIARDVMECLQAGESVSVSTQGGTYTITLIKDDEVNRHGRFVSPPGRLPASDWTEAAPLGEPVRELEAVG